MKTALILLVSLAVSGLAQDAKHAEERKQAEKQADERKLGTVTWDLHAHKLVWTVQKGAEVNGEFVPSSEDRYEISPDDAIMAYSNEKRGFTEDEATSLHHLLDVLSMYCAESVVWWDQGQGTPVGPGSKSAEPKKQPEKSKKPGDRPTKVDEHPKAAPAHPVNSGDLVAIARGLH